MLKKKLILLQIENEFYLQVPEEIYLDKYREDIEGNMLVLNHKYYYFAKDKNVNYTKDFHNIGYAKFDGSINIIYLKDGILTIPKDIFKIHKDNFNKLKKILKKYDNIFEVELKEYYGNSFKTNKIKIEYEVIKLENPIKKKNYLFRLKDNNIPKNWVEQSEYLIKRLENLNSKYGNISQNKINLIDFNGCIPKNICFMISEEYAKRLDDLFKSWNDGNKKSKRMKLVEYLFNIYGNDVTSNKQYYSIKVDERITLQVDVEKLEILEFKTMYHNIDISSYYRLSECVENIQKEIDNIKLS